MKLIDLLSDIEYEYSEKDAKRLDDEVTSLCYDSRYATTGALFVPLPGVRYDGHDYVSYAYDFGCRMFLCERRVELPEDALVIVTDNTRRALSLISHRFFGNPERKLHLIGITGTKGKTTTALMLCGILNGAGKPCGYIGSNGVDFAGRHFNTNNTTPESYELSYYLSMMAEAGVTHVVLEVSSQALFNYRVEGMDFEVCAFTNLYRDHIGRYEHPTFEHYRASKKRLFTEHGAKYIVYSADDPSSEYMLEGSSALSAGFSIDHEAEYTASRIERYSTSSVLGVSFTMKSSDREIDVKLPTPGAFSVCNALCAAAMADYYGVSFEVIADALSKCTPKGRFEVVPVLDYATFIIDYAHNGVSLGHALSVLREYSPKRIICLFGSVGGRTFKRRRELAEVAGELADFSIITADNPDHEEPAVINAEIESHLPAGAPHIVINSRADAIKYAVEQAQPGDIVLLAGKGHEDYQLFQGEKIPFSEREYLLKYASELSSKYAFKPEGETAGV